MKRIVLQNCKTIENHKKLQNNTKVSVKNIIFSNVADLRSGYSKVAELQLLNLRKMNSLGRFEDHLDFEKTNSLNAELQFKFNCSLTVE